MSSWAKGGALGSLRKRVGREVKEHRKSNVALLGAYYPVTLRAIRKFFGERGLFGFIAPYVTIVLALLATEVVVAKRWPQLVPAWTESPAIGPLLSNVTSYFLSAQVVMVGLLFPIAVGLVTLIVQREDASSTVSDVQVYYSWGAPTEWSVLIVSA